MRVWIEGKSVKAERAETDPKIHNESLLYYKIKGELIEAGHDVIKKLMSKDGHLTSEGRYYIRERKGQWCAVDNYYAIRSLCLPYNNFETVSLDIIGDLEPKPNQKELMLMNCPKCQGGVVKEEGKTKGNEWYCSRCDIVYRDRQDIIQKTLDAHNAAVEAFKDR